MHFISGCLGCFRPALGLLSPSSGHALVQLLPCSRQAHPPPGSLLVASCKKCMRKLLRKGIQHVWKHVAHIGFDAFIYVSRIPFVWALQNLARNM